MSVQQLEQLDFYQAKLAWEIDAWDLYVALSSGENVVIVDGRSAEAFEKEHIPGAINKPHRTICDNSLSDLNKNACYVTYCDGIGCNASTKTALKMLTLGFRVKEMIGGLDWWKRDGYATHGTHSQNGTMIQCGCQI